jgi:ABC-type antimicrobial peptide transport system permease subunit
LVVAQTAPPVLYGLLAGVALAASLATVLIATPVGGVLSEIVRVSDPIAYSASVLLIVTACAFAAFVPAIRAARLDPMKTLRQE